MIRTTERLGGKRVEARRTSKAGLIDDPQPAVLLPWEVLEEMVFRVDVVAECSRAEEHVEEATLGKLAENLQDRI